jgi:WD40 repeat protein
VKRLKVADASTTSAALFADGDGGVAHDEYRSTKFHDVCVSRGVIRRIFEFAREHESDERRAVSVSTDGTLKVWDLESYTEISTIETTGYDEDDGVSCCAVFADGTPRVLTASECGGDDGEAVDDGDDGVPVLSIWG